MSSTASRSEPGAHGPVPRAVASRVRYTFAQLPACHARGAATVRNAISAVSA